MHFWQRSVDQTPFAWDQMTHLIFTLDYFKLLQEGSFYDFFYSFDWYTPFVYWVGSLFASFVPHLFLGLVINIFFLTIFLFSLIFFRTTKKVGHTLLISLLFLHLILPQPTSAYWAWLSIRDFLLDIPLALMICALYTLYLFIEKNRKIDMKTIILFSLFITATNLTKNTGVIYTAPFFLFFTVKILISKENRLKKIIFLSVFLVLIILQNRWFFINFKEFQKINNIHLVNGYLENDPQGLTGLFTNFKWIVSYSPGLNILVLLTFIFFHKKIYKNFRKEKNIVVLPIYLFLMLLIFSLISNKEPRYILPLTWLFYYEPSKYLAEKLPEKILFAAIILLSVLLPLHTFINLSKPRSNQTAYHYIKNMITVLNPKSMGFFYEIDGPFFNYASAIYLAKINNLNFHNVNENHPYVDNELLKTCNLTDSDLILFVYSTAAASTYQDSNDVSFDDVCGKKISKKCTFYSQKIFSDTDEKVRIFNCK